MTNIYFKDSLHVFFEHRIHYYQNKSGVDHDISE